MEPLPAPAAKPAQPNLVQRSPKFTSSRPKGLAPVDVNVNDTAPFPKMGVLLQTGSARSPSSSPLPAISPIILVPEPLSARDDLSVDPSTIEKMKVLQSLWLISANTCVEKRTY